MAGTLGDRFPHETRTDHDTFGHGAGVNPDHFHQVIRLINEIVDPSTGNHGRSAVVE